jgi:hypothetical protein
MPDTPSAVEALRLAARTFRQYENIHRSKGTSEGYEKADANADVAAKMEVAIAALEQGDGEKRGACENCDSTMTDAEISAAGFVSCCPERKVSPTPSPGASWSEEQIERAARAIFARVRHLDPKISLEDAGDYYDRMDETLKPFWREQAKDALASLQPPAGEDQGARAVLRLSTDADPIPMLLFCPACGTQHIDAPESALVWTGGAVPEPSHDETTWDNPPHRSHLCHGCGHIWRPADVPTTGVAAIKTRGSADSPTPPPGGVGWKLVPRERTEAMRTAAINAPWGDYGAVWRAMYDAAPAQPTVSGYSREAVAEFLERGHELRGSAFSLPPEEWAAIAEDVLAFKYPPAQPEAMPGREEIVSALAECRKRARAEKNAWLAKEGLWPDNDFTPTDEQYADAILALLSAKGE